jgi:hypothetical protein
MARVTATVIVALAAASGCELQEITTAAPVDFVVAEIVLQAGQAAQYAYLQRSLGSGDVEVKGAQIVIVDEASGDSLRFQQTDPAFCLQPLPEEGDVVGTCYHAVSTSNFVRPGRAYQLRIGLPNGGRLTGRTIVPAEVRLARPAEAVCALPPDTTLELVWTRAADAWVYDVEVKLHDIFPHLVARGVVADTPNVPLRLDGLSITAADTTLVIPSELGLFDRFNADLHPILLALQRGLPEGVRGEVVVAAADRNYVNWARGGSFNPSGLVRIPSVRGDGTGVFGSMTSDQLTLLVTRGAGLPACH